MINEKENKTVNRSGFGRPQLRTRNGNNRAIINSRLVRSVAGSPVLLLIDMLQRHCIRKPTLFFFSPGTRILASLGLECSRSFLRIGSFVRLRVRRLLSTSKKSNQQDPDRNPCQEKCTNGTNQRTKKTVFLLPQKTTK